MLGEVIKQIIESRYICIFPIINIDMRLTEIIGDLRELSAKISILKKKITGKWSKNYRYGEKNYFLVTPNILDNFWWEA